MPPKFFATPAALRKWLRVHHKTASELWIGFYKKGTGKKSITWPESVDEALAVGWIDGIRKRIDDESYMIRFTPRRATSIWSAVNIKRVAVLTGEGRMLPAGLAAFEKRTEYKSGIYAYEQRPITMPEPYAGIFRKNTRAWAFFESQPPGQRKRATWWIISAKKEETRLKRLTALIEDAAAEIPLKERLDITARAKRPGT